MKTRVPLRLRGKSARLPHLPNEILILILHSLPLEALAHTWTKLRLVNKLFKEEVEGYIRNTLIKQIQLIIECGKLSEP